MSDGFFETDHQLPQVGKTVEGVDQMIILSGLREWKYVIAVNAERNR